MAPRNSWAANSRFAAILGRSDSRVIPELIFDQGLGDLFVVRIAGNVIAADVAGSLQYAGRHLHVQLLVVLGHEGCGAVAAALGSIYHREEHPEHIEALVKLIEPGLKDLDPRLTRRGQLHAAVEANLLYSMHQIAESPAGRRRLEEEAFEMVSAVYRSKDRRGALSVLMARPQVFDRAEQSLTGVYHGRTTAWQGVL